ncbi:autotransporter-associated beta strand repeat-containing protein [Prosthecobacter sp.]
MLPLAVLLSTLVAGQAEALLSIRAANAVSYSVWQYSWSGMSSAGGVTSRWSDAGNWFAPGVPLRHVQPFPGVEIFNEVTINLDTQAVDRAVRLDTLNTLVFYDYDLYGLHFAGSRQVSLTGDNVWPVDSEGKFQTQYPPSPFPLSIWMGGMSNHSPYAATFRNIDLTVDGSQEWKAVNGGFDLSSVLLGSSALTLLGGQPVTMGALTGHGSITWATRAGYAAPGVLEIGSAASFSGLVDIGTGTLKLTNDVGAAFAFNGRITGSGPVIITGNRTLAGPDAYTHTGEMQMDGGLLLLNKTSVNGTVTGSALRASSAIVRLAQPNQIGDAVAVRLLNGSILDLAAHQEAIGTLELAGSSVVGSGRLILTRGSVSVLADLSDSFINTEVDMNDVATTWNVVGGLQVPGRLTRGRIVKQGAGTLTLSADNSLTGITHEAGTIVVTRDAALAPTFTFKGGTLQMAAGFDTLAPHRQFTVEAAGGTLDTNGVNISLGTPLGGTGTLVKTGAGKLALVSNSSVGGIDVRNGSLQVSGSTHIGALTLASGSLQAGADVDFSAASTWSLLPAAAQAAGTPNVSSINTNGMTMSMPGVISGSGGLTVIGGGTLHLGGANTYTGITKVDGSTLRLASIAGLGGSDVLLLQNGARMLVSGASITFGGQLDLQGGLGVFDISGGTFTSNGSLTGTGELEKRGTGELRLNGTSAFSGQFRVTGGTLALQTALSAGAVTGIVLNGGSLRLLNPMTLAVPVTSFAAESVIDIGANNVSLSQPLGGSLIKQGTGTLTLAAAGNGTFDTLTIAAGLVEFSTALSLPSNITLDGGGLRWAAGSTADISGRRIAVTASGGTLDLGANNVTFAQGSDWTGPVTKTGTGRLTLRGGGTFLGGLVVQDGVVAFDEAQARAIQEVISGAGAVEHLGTAALTLGGANTFAGGLTVSGGGDVIIPDGGTPGAGGVNLQNGRLVFDQCLDATFGGIVSGAGQVVKKGAGMLTLSGANSFTGGVAVSGGTLVAAHPAALGSGGDITLDAAVLRATAALTLASSRHMSLSNGSILETALGAVLTVNGIASGGPLLKTGAGTLIFGNANTFTGPITVNAGTLATTHPGALGGSSGLVLNAATFRADATLTTSTGYTVALQNGAALEAGPGATLTLAGVLSGGPLVKNGAGALVLTNANTFAGGITLNAGTLTGRLAALPGNVSGTGGTLRVDEGVSAAWKVQVSGGVGLEFFNSTTSFGVLNLDAATLLTHSGTTQISSGMLVNLNAASTLSAASALVVNGQLDLAGGSQTVASLAGGGLIYSFSTSAVTATLAAGSDNTSTTYTGALADNTGYGAGKLALWKAGTGMLTLAGANSFTGGIIVSGDGTLYGTHVGAFGAAGTITLSSGNLRSGVTMSLDAARLITITGNGGTLNVDAGTRLTVDSVISGSALFTKAGAGTLALTASNTFTGGTHITGGLIEFTMGSNLGTGGLTLNGGGLRWATGSTYDVSPRLNPLGDGGGVFDIQGNDITFGSPLSGSGGLTKSGAGTLTLAVDPTYTGPTSVLAGRLVINGSPDGSVSVAAGAEIETNGPLNSLGLAGDGLLKLGGGVLTLTVPEGVFTSFNGTITTTGGVVKNGAGTQALAGPNNFTGGLTLNAGVLQGNGDASLGASGSPLVFDGGTLRWGLSFDINGTRAITLQAGGGALDVSLYTTTITQNISGSGALTKLGTGTLSLQGANTFTGGIHLDKGMLVGTAASLPGTITTQPGTILRVDQNTDAVWNGSLAGGGSVEMVNQSGYGVLRMGTGQAHTNSGPTLIGPNVYLVAPATGGTNALSAASAYTVNGVVDLSGFTQTISSLTGNGRVYSYSTSGATGTLIVGGGGASTTFSGLLQDNSGSLGDQGRLAVVKNGAGTFRPTGMNTFSAGLTVNGGVVEFGNAANLGTGPITLNGGTLYWLAGNNADISSRLEPLGPNGGVIDVGANAVTFANAPTGSGKLTVRTDNPSGSLSFQSALRHTGDTEIQSTRLTLTSDVDSTYAGVISGFGALDKFGTGTLTLTGASTFGGTIALNQGRLHGSAASLPAANIMISNDTTLQFDQAVDGRWSGSLFSTGTGTLLKTGAGTLTLSGVNRLGGITRVLGGFIEIASPDAFNAAVYLDGAGIRWGPGVTTFPLFETFGPNGATLDTNGNNILLTGSLYGEGAFTKNGAGTLTLPGRTGLGGITVNGGTLAGTSGNFLSPTTITVAVGAQLLLDQAGVPDHLWLASTIQGAGSLRVKNSGTSAAVLRLAPSAQFHHTGATQVDAGTALVLRTADALATSSGLTLDGSLDLGGFAQTISRLSGSGQIYSASSSPAVATLTVAQDSDSTFSGSLSNSVIGHQGVTTLRKTGTGVLTLTNASTHSGGVTVGGGRIDFSHATALGTGALTLDGGSAKWTGSADAALANDLRLAGGGGTFDTGTANVSFGSALSGTGAFTKQGAGKLSVGGLQITGDVTIGSGTLEVQSGAASSHTATVNGSGTLIKSGEGALTLNAASDLHGAVAVTRGTLVVNGRISGATSVASGGTLGGSGTMGSLVLETGATLAPGTAAFTDSGDGFDLQSGSLVLMELTPGGVSDQLKFIGDGTNSSLTFSSELKVTFATPGAAQPQPGIFQLLDWSGLAHAPVFAAHFYQDLIRDGSDDNNSAWDLPDLSGASVYWDLSRFTMDGTIELVPEPDRCLLLLSGLFLACLRRRRSPGEAPNRQQQPSADA